jgi:hypothetical protein
MWRDKYHHHPPRTLTVAAGRLCYYADRALPKWWLAKGNFHQSKLPVAQRAPVAAPPPPKSVPPARKDANFTFHPNDLRPVTANIFLRPRHGADYFSRPQCVSLLGLPTRNSSFAPELPRSDVYNVWGMKAKSCKNHGWSARTVQINMTLQGAEIQSSMSELSYLPSSIVSSKLG